MVTGVRPTAGTAIVLAGPAARVVTRYRGRRGHVSPAREARFLFFSDPMADSIIQSPDLGDVTGYLRDRIRTVPDWPMPGVMFRDITPLLQDPKTLRVLIDVFVHRYMDAGLDLVAGIDARGFILGAIVAYELNLGFVPIRKKGKLPFQTVAEEYELEYGSATVEIHADACKAGDRVLLVDDLIATGGTMMAGRKLLERLGATVVEGAAIVDLPELGGSRLLQDGGLPLFTVCRFDGH
ncbi:Adenine phosphoribosyltransferase [Cupriavidus oxalaticus]|jgi:adenine phosphoribosyltransferase|uniref:Adenine phosphoribosyltransferase n=2 Tax=Cupriavidus oxalaticus TaxID=96344 RepID=A0A375G8H0_9BURK|nr:Adenine phosphoribosyltransferase [Cupriavidus oxalaticus]